MNYFLRHLQRFWGASGDFWQAQWDKILDKFGDDPDIYWIHGKKKLTHLILYKFLQCRLIQLILYIESKIFEK